jgi:predicted phosphodiesterase
MTKSRRTKKPKPKADAILCADPHIRPNVPICRTDDFFQAMSDKLDTILDLSKRHDCPILVAGDLGRRPLNNGWPTWLLEWTINKFEGHEIICICGQHDLPNHRLDLFGKSGMGVLHAARAIEVIQRNTITFKGIFNINAFHYGQEIIRPKIINQFPNIAMTHQMIIENKLLFPGQEAPKGHQLLKKFPQYDLILSGDNHNAFTVEQDGRWLVNPGSMMRTTADQIDHKPRVYLWWAETNEIQAVYLPIQHGVISREHIKDSKGIELRNQAFIERVNSMDSLEIVYEDNIAEYFKKYRTEKSVKNKVFEALN